MRGYFQYRGSDDEERQFVESPDGHYVVTVEQRARWDRTLSALAQMQAEIDVLCTEQGPEPQRPRPDSAFVPAIWANSLTQAMTKQLLLKPEES